MVLAIRGMSREAWIATVIELKMTGVWNKPIRFSTTRAQVNLKFSHTGFLGLGFMPGVSSLGIGLGSKHIIEEEARVKQVKTQKKVLTSR